jgi:hypothetical protein
MGWILSPIVHSLMFCQTIEGNIRTVCFELMGNVVFPPPDNMGGNWVLNRADSDSVVAVVLYRGVTGSDRKRLIWRYDATQHGGLIEIGINTPSEDHKNGKYMTFSKWFSLHDAKLLASGEFRVQSGPYPGGDAPAWYVPGGSSDTFKQGSGTWSVRRYNRQMHATTG